MEAEGELLLAGGGPHAFQLSLKAAHLLLRCLQLLSQPICFCCLRLSICQLLPKRRCLLLRLLQARLQLGDLLLAATGS